MFSRRQAYFIVFLLAVVYMGPLRAQNKYRVFFKDKQTVFNPYTYFDMLAIERRLKMGLPVADSTDYPVNTTYINNVTTLADSIRPASRWFNCMSVFTDAGRAAQIAQLPFVKLVEPLYPDYPQPLLEFDSTLRPNNKKLIDIQIDLLQGQQFIDSNITGKGIRIAILDAGFPNVNTNPAFKHIRDDGRIIATYDFCKKRENVYNNNPHGTMVMACIAGKTNGKNIGLATGASFLLARTESPGFEIYSEEEYWMQAAEWADKNGAHIINSSLGYTSDLYFKRQMDGRHSIIAKAATMAVKKGILVVNAAGNEGSGSWKIIASPGDADSVLTVGGVDPYKQYHSGFSSYGPNKGLKMKPNVCAAGTVTTIGPANITQASGTSFASPLTAGFAACVWQLNPTWTNNDIFDNIQKSGHLYPYYDYAHGFGIPQAGYFLKSDSAVKPTFIFSVDEGNFGDIILTDSSFNAEWPEHMRMVYYHIENAKGYLDKYYVIAAESREPLSVPMYKMQAGEKLRVHYKGYTYTYTKTEQK